jgi:DNA-directed RNA polymerase subunit RPC12/RpoP
MRKPYRCLDCSKHFTKTRRPEQYVREPRCPRCRSKRVRYDEYEWKRRLARKRHVCLCSGAPYPHRKGSLVWCEHHPTGPTDADWLDLYSYAS